MGFDGQYLRNDICYNCLSNDDPSFTKSFTKSFTLLRKSTQTVNFFFFPRSVIGARLLPYRWQVGAVLENLGHGIVNGTYASIGLGNNRQRLHRWQRQSIDAVQSARCTCNKHRIRVHSQPYEYYYSWPRVRPIVSLSLRRLPNNSVPPPPPPPPCLLCLDMWCVLLTR